MTLNHANQPRSRRRLHQRLFGSIGKVIADADRQCRLELDQQPGFDWKTTVVLLSAMVIICLQEYVFQTTNVANVGHCLRLIGAEGAANAFDDWRREPENREIARLGYWAIARVVTFVFVPMLLIKFVLRDRIRDYGTRVRGVAASLPVYGLMLAFMAPIVLFYSQTESFQSKYPFYDLRPGETLGVRFWTWEILYCLQFIALEFFFRGFMVHGTKHRFGAYSILVMTFPYVMIHFGKPMPETFSAIGAGLVLGFMSLKTCSIWMGAVLHIAVAMNMDLLSLWHRGLL